MGCQDFQNLSIFGIPSGGGSGADCELQIGHFGLSGFPV